MNDNRIESEESQIADNVLVIERIFKARPERVFEAFASLEALARWFGPEGCQVVGGEVDFREGGSYRLRLEIENAQEIELVGAYQLIESPGHLAFSWRWEKNPDHNPCDSFVEIMFMEHEEGTRLRLVQTGIDDDQDRSNHGVGWNGTFDRLKRLFS